MPGIRRRRGRAFVGAQFDPELHEAVDTIEVEPERDGIVTSEYSRGYKIGDRLIKPARVQVGRSKEGFDNWRSNRPCFCLLN